MQLHLSINTVARNHWQHMKCLGAGPDGIETIHALPRVQPLRIDGRSRSLSIMLTAITDLLADLVQTAIGRGGRFSPKTGLTEMVARFPTRSYLTTPTPDLQNMRDGDAEVLVVCVLLNTF